MFGGEYIQTAWYVYTVHKVAKTSMNWRRLRNKAEEITYRLMKEEIMES
jgi:hypothetical protein